MSVTQDVRDNAAVILAETSDKEVGIGKPIIDYDTLALKLNVPVELVEDITRAVIKAQTDAAIAKVEDPDTIPTEDILRGQLTMLASAIETADYEYQDDPTSDNAYALTSLVNTAQTVLKNLRELCAVQDTIDQVIRLVLQPYTKAALKHLLSEMGYLRNDVLEHAAPSSRTEISHVFEDRIRRIGHVYREEYDAAIENLRKTLRRKR